MHTKKKYFEIKLDFDRDEVNSAIENLITSQGKGYVCVVDGNVLATAVLDPKYREIVNHSVVNTCDGASIAILASLIHRKKFLTYTGYELFSNFISKPYRQLILGNTAEANTLLRAKFKANKYDTSNLFFRPLPFLNVDEFDYSSISDIINNIKPDIVWISLGAPKQEYFIHHLYPLIKKGVLVAIGAALNFYIDTGKYKRAPSLFLKFKLEWLYRSYKEPQRIGKRALKYAKLLPSLITREIKAVYFSL